MKSRLFRLIWIFLLPLFPVLGACSGSPDSKADLSAKTYTENDIQTESPVARTAARLPRMLDLGSVDCIPCKKMAPILDSLKIVYQGRAEIEFIDIRKNMAAAREHGVTMIPTQIFFDVEGKEVSRHIGFFPADSIVARLSLIGVTL